VINRKKAKEEEASLDCVVAMSATVGKRPYMAPALLSSFLLLIFAALSGTTSLSSFFGAGLSSLFRS
jgi:hypothetical protein